MLPTGRLPVSRGRPRRATTRQPSPRLVSLFPGARWDRVGEWRRPARRLEEGGPEMAPEAEAIVDQIDDEGKVLSRSTTTSSCIAGTRVTSSTLRRWSRHEPSSSVRAATLRGRDDPERRARRRAPGPRRRLSGIRAAPLGHLGASTRSPRASSRRSSRATRRSFGRIRDLAMPLMAKVPHPKRMMTLGMLGVLDGFFGETPHARAPWFVQRKPASATRRGKPQKKKKGQDAQRDVRRVAERPTHRAPGRPRPPSRTRFHRRP